MADEKIFHLKIISPTRIFYEGQAKMLEFTGSEGQMGVYAQHAPTTVVLEPGVLRITEDDGDVRIAAVHSGFVEILPEDIMVMAEVAEWPAEIDAARAHEARVRAERRLSSNAPNINQMRAQIALRRALTREQVAKEKNI